MFAAKFATKLAAAGSPAYRFWELLLQVDYRRKAGKLHTIFDLAASDCPIDAVTSTTSAAMKC